MTSLTNVFLGVPQSHLAGLAILLVILTLAFFILFGKEKISFGQKLAIVLLMFLMALPTILVTLFQLTCVVTGAGFKNQRPWCSLYAWLVTALIVAYCVLMVVAAVLSFSKSQSILSQTGFPFDVAGFNNMTKEYFANMPEEEQAIVQAKMIEAVAPKEAAERFTGPATKPAERFTGAAAAAITAAAAKPAGRPAAPRVAETFVNAAHPTQAEHYANANPPATKGPVMGPAMGAAAPPAFEGFNGSAEYASPF
jgi:hypothetical protein